MVDNVSLREQRLIVRCVYDSFLKSSEGFEAFSVNQRKINIENPKQAVRNVFSLGGFSARSL
jgi:hypothetical protein